MTDAMHDPGAFARARSERLRADWRASYQPRNPIASDLHDCARYQVIRIVGWKVRETPDDAGLEVIEDGRLLELAILRQLADEGWELSQQQFPIEIRQPLVPGGPRKLLLTGKGDARIRRTGDSARPVPLEIKATSDYVFEALDDEADVRALSVWSRKWWRQMQVYLLGSGAEYGVLLLGFRGHRKAIPIAIDYDEGERILQVASWAVAQVERAQEEGLDETSIDPWLTAHGGELGAYHRDAADCRRCPFFKRACFPPEPARGAAQVREDLAEHVRRWIELKPLASEKDRLQKLLKAETEGFAQTVAGEWILEGSVATRRMKEQPAKPAHVAEYWSFEARPVGER